MWWNWVRVFLQAAVLEGFVLQHPASPKDKAVIRRCGFRTFRLVSVHIPLCWPWHPANDGSGADLNNSNSTGKKKVKFHLGQVSIQTHHPVKPELELVQRKGWGVSCCHMWRASLSFWVPARLESTQGNSETASETLEDSQAKKPRFWEHEICHFKFLLAPSLHIKTSTSARFLCWRKMFWLLCRGMNKGSENLRWLLPRKL